MTDNTERDELAELISSVTIDASSGYILRTHPDGETPVFEGDQRTADAILAAGSHWPRTIKSIAQLELLPIGSVVLDDDQTAFQRADEYDDENETSSLWTRDSDLLFPPFHIILPALLLWEPEA